MTSNKGWVSMKQKKQKLSFGILFIIILSTSFQGCAPPTPTPTATATLPASVTPIGEPTPTNCPYVTPIPSPTPSNKPKLIYALIDRSGSYGAYTESAITVLVQSLILSIQPGDAIYLVWLGEDEDPDDYLLYGTVPPLETLVLTPAVSTLTPIPTSTETIVPAIVSPPSEQLTELEKLVAAQTATAQSINETATAQALNVTATNEASIRDYNVNSQQCLQVAINDFNQQKLQEQDELKKKIIQAYITETLAPLLTATVQVPDKGTHIYNNIYIASKVMQTEQAKGNYSSYYLLILSDMEDVGSNRGRDLHVNLKGINVMVAMMYCEEVILCQERNDYWQHYFTERGATLPYNPFRMIQETTPESIADFFNQ